MPTFARRIVCSATAVLLALVLVTPRLVSAQVVVTTHHNDNLRTGANTRETVLTPLSVNRGGFGMLFRRAVDDQLYTQPLVVTGVSVGGGLHDLVFVTTVNNSVYAFDANDPEAVTPVWHVNFGTPANVYSANFNCLDINGRMGIIGTPAIDKARGALYVVALTQSRAGFTQRLHALDLATGADLPASPVTIKAPAFDPLMQNQRPGLMVANDMVYIGYASHCDRQPYHGFLMAYDATTLRQVRVFNTTPTGSEASIWQSGQGPSADADGNVYVITGNGSWDGVRNFSESFLKLSPKLTLLDWFTPTNHLLLDAKDGDLNATGASLIPGTHLVVGGGKDGVFYALDTRRLGHLGDEHATQHFKATPGTPHSLVYWASTRRGPLLYVWAQRDTARAFRIDLAAGRLVETPVMKRDSANGGHPGAMLSLSANGGANGILWAAIHASGDSWHESRPGILYAFDADDITHELWNSLQVPERDDCGAYSKMAPPTIANGKVYLASFGTENVGTGQLCVYGTLPARNGAAPTAPAGLKVDVVAGTATITWNASAGATYYRVRRTSTRDPKPRWAATGLRSPTFVEPAPARRDTTTYTVFVVGPGGATGDSAVVTVPKRTP
ncbi:MAG: hypothetical protein ABIP93_19270 [Gemmatimonadaceae bacterium]